MKRLQISMRIASAANLRDSWQARARRTKTERTAGHLVGLSLRPCTIPLDAGIVLTLARIAPRALDDDNLAACFKAFRDGVADAFGVDDRDPRITWRYDQRRGKAREYAVEISVSARTRETEIVTVPIEMSSHLDG